MTATIEHESTVEVLDDLASTIDDNARDSRRLAGRLRRLRDRRAEGRSWEDILSNEPHPRTLELASRILTRLAQSSGKLRRVLANGLHAEGTSISAIAARFGVSRQRVSALLRRHDDRDDD